MRGHTQMLKDAEKGEKSGARPQRGWDLSLKDGGISLGKEGARELHVEERARESGVTGSRQ